MKNKLIIDLETRSRVSLKGQKSFGLYVYAEDESTEVLCVAFKWNYEPVRLWVPGPWGHLAENFLLETAPEPWGCLDDALVDIPQINRWVAEADEIEAHNVNFERQLWHHVICKKYWHYGEVEDLPFEKLRCSAAKAATVAIPRNLAGACETMGVSAQKDTDGHKVMLKMCKPRKPTIKNPREWHEDPEEFAKLCRYCMQDVAAEHALSEVLPELTPPELDTFRLDIVINERGIHCDKPAIGNLKAKVKEEEARLLPEMQRLTQGTVHSSRQTEACRQWLWNQGLQLNDLQKYTLVKALEIPNLPDKVRRVVEIRQALSMTSVSKTDTMLRWSCRDGRIKGSMMYHGASTGRWAGKGIQPQNYPRAAYDDVGVNAILGADAELIQLMEGSVSQAVSSCLRGMLCAPEGRALLCADYSAIEARVLAWLAHEESKLAVFREGKDPYLYAAATIYKTSYEALAARDGGKPKERKIGKVVDLACGYQGWTGAFASMAGNYGVDVPEEEAKEAILGWRNGHPNIVNLWQGLMDAAIAAVKSGQPHAYGYLKLYLTGPWLCMRLPSGRSLYYFDPRVEMKTDRFGRTRETIGFWGMKTEQGTARRWMKLHLYGGLLTENATQAVARDILVHGLKLVDPRYPVVMHVHDEAVSELEFVPNERQAKEILLEYENLLATNPSWAVGLPLQAEGWIGRRYRK